MRTMMSKVLTALVLMILAQALPVLSQAWPGSLVVGFDKTDPIAVKANGEIHVYPEEIFTLEGVAHRVSLAFQDLGQYEAALALGAKSVSLAALESAFIINREAELATVPLSKGATIFHAAEVANGALCGNIYARSRLDLAPGLMVDIAVHSSRIDGGFTTFPSPRLLSSSFKDADVGVLASGCSLDVFDDCPRSPPCNDTACIDVYRFRDGTVRTYNGVCEKNSINPTLCTCHSTTVITDDEP